MSRAGICLLKHMGKGSPIEAYRADMTGDVAERMAASETQDAAWLAVIDEKLAERAGEKARIEQVVADAYAKTPAAKVAPEQPDTQAAAPPQAARTVAREPAAVPGADATGEARKKAKADREEAATKAAEDPRQLGIAAAREGKPRDPPESLDNFDRQAWRAGWDQAKKPTAPTPQLPTDRQMATFIGIAADSIEKLRSSDVDRVIREAPTIYRVAVAQHIRTKRPDLTQDVADSLEDLGATPAPQAPEPEAAPAWHTPLPTQGEPSTQQDRTNAINPKAPVDARKVSARLAAEAFAAITQAQQTNLAVSGMKLYPWVLPAQGNRNGVVRLLPEDQRPGAPWQQVGTEHANAGGMRSRAINDLIARLGSAPIIGDENAAATATAPQESAADIARRNEYSDRIRAYWDGTATPAIRDYLRAFDAFGADRLERNRVKPAGMTAREWLESYVARQSTWDKGRKTGLTGIQSLSRKDLWPTDDGIGERLRKAMLEAVKALKNAPGSNGDLMDEAFMEPKATTKPRRATSDQLSDATDFIIELKGSAKPARTAAEAWQRYQNVMAVGVRSGEVLIPEADFVDAWEQFNPAPAAPAAAEPVKAKEGATTNLNKPRAVPKKQALTPGGSLKADATNSRADSAVWYYQGDMGRLRFTASVTIDGKPDLGAAQAKELLAQIKAAQDAGWKRANYRAGSLGTVWVYERGDEFLTRAGMENAGSDVTAWPDIPSYGAGYDNMVRGQREFAAALDRWLNTLPADQQQNQGVVSRKMADVLGGWAGIERDNSGLWVRYYPRQDDGRRAVRWLHTIPASQTWEEARAKIAKMAGPTRTDDAGNVAMFSRAPGVRSALDAAIEAKAAFDAVDRASVKVDDAGAYFKLSEAYSDARDALANELESQPNDGFALQGKTRDGRDLIVNASAQQPGKWQLTRFDRKGEPWGDSQYNTKASALTDFLREIDLNSLRDIEGAFSRAQVTPRGLSLDEAEAIVGAVREANPTAPPMIVLESVDQAPSALLRDIIEAGAANDVEAAYHEGKVYVFAPHLRSMERAMFVIAHHELRHHGMRSLEGRRLSTTLAGMVMSNPNLRDAARAKMDAGLAKDMIQGAEEALADMDVAEVQALKGWPKVLAAVRQWLRGMASRLRAKGHTTLADAIDPKDWTDADVAGFVARAEAVSKGGRAKFGTDGTVFASGGEVATTLAGGAVARLNTVLRGAGWEVEYIDIDLTGDKPKADIRIKRDDGRFLIAKVDSIGRASFETFQRERTLGIDQKNRQARLAPQIDDIFLGRQRFEGARSMLRSMVQYLTDNATRPVELADMRAAWAGVMAAPTAQTEALPAPAQEPGQLPLFSRRTYDPTTTEALKRAGIGGPPSAREKIRAHWTRAMQLVTDRNELAQQMRQGTLDQFAGIQRAVRRDVGNLPAEQDPYIAARLANGGTSSVMRALLLHGQAQWAANGQHLEKKPGTRGLLDILKPLGDDVNDWFGWMVGNRAARLMSEGRENNFTADQIKALQALATPEKKAAFQKAAMEYTAFKRSVLDLAQAAGLINPESRKAWDHADYIPFYRQVDERSIFSATGRKGLSGQTSGIRTLKGGEAALNDPLENLLMNFSRLVDASLKNNAINRTIRALEEVDSTAVHKVGYDMTPALVPTEQVRKLLIEAGTHEAVMDAIPEEVFEGISKMWSIQQPTDPAVVRVMRGGKPVFYRVDDPLLLQSLTSFVPFDFPGLGMMRAAKRLLTATVTATPEFMLRNFIRDSVAAQAIARDGFNPAKSLQGIAKSFNESGGFESMLFAGASFQSGNVNAANPEATGVAIRRSLRSKGIAAAMAQNGFTQTLLDTGAKFWEKYREVGEAIENANREAVYEAATKEGKSPTAAAYEAKDLMDFSLRGSWAGYQLLADVLPFFNARVQGLYRVGRADPKRLATVGLMLTAASLMLAMANDGEDWYEELPDWDKDTYWHFRIGKQHFRIPKPFELGVIFATIPERIGRSIKGLDSGKKTGSRLWANVRDQLAFDPVPQLARPVLNVWANKDSFRDAPIESMSDEGKLPHLRYSARTSDTMRALTGAAPGLSDASGLSPKKLEYLLGGYLGTAGLYALALSDMLVRQLEGKPPGPSLRADDLPVVKAFYRVDPARATVFESDLYKMRAEVDAIAKSIKASAKDNPEEAARLQTTEKDKLAVRNMVVNAAKSITTLNRQRDQIYADKTMPPDEKRKQVDELQRKKNALAKQVAEHPMVKAAF